VLGFSSSLPYFASYSPSLCTLLPLLFLSLLLSKLIKRDVLYKTRSLLLSSRTLGLMHGLTGKLEGEKEKSCLCIRRRQLGFWGRGAVTNRSRAS